MLPTSTSHSSASISSAIQWSPRTAVTCPGTRSEP
jgi:hypothetical protein